jgi:hypothetical protein
MRSLCNRLAGSVIWVDTNGRRAGARNAMTDLSALAVVRARALIGRTDGSSWPPTPDSSGRLSEPSLHEQQM